MLNTFVMVEAVVIKRCGGAAIAKSVLRMRRRLVALYAVATLADALTTYVGIKLVGVVEENPLVALLFNTFGVESVLIALSLLAVTLYYLMVSVPHPLATCLGVGHVIMRFAVVVHNVLVIFRMHSNPATLLAMAPILFVACARAKNRVFSTSDLHSTLRPNVYKAPNLSALTRTPAS